MNKDRTIEISRRSLDKEKSFFVFDLRQANYFMSKGLIALRVGKGKKDGKTFVQFKDSKELREVFSEWCDLCRVVSTD